MRRLKGQTDAIVAFTHLSLGQDADFVAALPGRRRRAWWARTRELAGVPRAAVRADHQGRRQRPVAGDRVDEPSARPGRDPSCRRGCSSSTTRFPSAPAVADTGAPVDRSGIRGVSPGRVRTPTRSSPRPPSRSTVASPPCAIAPAYSRTLSWRRWPTRPRRSTSRSSTADRFASTMSCRRADHRVRHHPDPAVRRQDREGDASTVPC